MGCRRGRRSGPIRPIKVQSLKKDQLKDIFSGKIDNWSVLGRREACDYRLHTDEAECTRAVFWEKALDKENISTKALFVPSNGAMKPPSPTIPMP